ncbi:hypothetical protein GGR54DRAFT_464760 [Hypoxylon sp. NC1633]|nr:hypothetical protein GGR54DRAFT_464760 [Hypoxylon sp. NC1633]
MAMASWRPSPGETTYTPPISSPLNPLSTETSPRRERRAMRKHEQSPTQRLMRQKAAAAWKSMYSREAAIMSYVQTMQNRLDMKLSRQTDDSHLGRTSAQHDSLVTSTGECDITDLGMEDADMEKQPLVNQYRERWPLETKQLPHTSIKKRLMLVAGIVCIIGFLSAVHAVGRMQLWRT